MQSLGPYKRLARQIRACARLATGDELAELARLQVLVRQDELCVFEAQRILTGVIRGQLRREQREGKKAA